MSNILLISPDRCRGCGSCELACSFKHEGEFRPAAARISVLRFKAGISVPLTCLQCDEPYCMAVCKTGAIVKNEVSGVVEVDGDKCIGCRMCVMACPFGNINYSIATKQAVKCDYCGGEPECALWCPEQAIEYVPQDTATLGRKKDYSARFARLVEEVGS
ncbi:MAG: 4Fe-4S dicluster domain-containing protein [Firmicutes bacterium]|nr:4Fe-4S dicluster domain-containing protein [Bacillota bacterium]